MTRDDHLLVCLTEECAEVIQGVDKALRFGLDDQYRDKEWFLSPRDYTVKELTDLIGVLELLCEAGVFRMWDIMDREKIDAKKKKVLEFLEYSKAVGRLEDK